MRSHTSILRHVKTRHVVLGIRRGELLSIASLPASVLEMELNVDNMSTENGQALPTGLPSELRDFMVLYGFTSGMMSTVIPKEARAVYHSQGGADMKDRISKTAKLGYDIGTANAFEPDGEMIVTCVKTRLVHAAVRHLLPQSEHWKAAADEEVDLLS